MKYLKHYWVNIDTGNYAVTENPVGKRHPEIEFPGLGVKIWMHDPDGIDVCLSTVPDNVEISNIVDESSGKKAVQKLTKTQFDSVSNPLNESQILRQEAQLETDETLKAQKEADAEAKFQEAIAAFNLL
jgi:hypothetical protein